MWTVFFKENDPKSSLCLGPKSPITYFILICKGIQYNILKCNLLCLYKKAVIVKDKLQVCRHYVYFLKTYTQKLQLRREQRASKIASAHTGETESPLICLLLLCVLLDIISDLWAADEPTDRHRPNKVGTIHCSQDFSAFISCNKRYHQNNIIKENLKIKPKQTKPNSTILTMNQSLSYQIKQNIFGFQTNSFLTFCRTND